MRGGLMKKGISTVIMALLLVWCLEGVPAAQMSDPVNHYVKTHGTLGISNWSTGVIGVVGVGAAPQRFSGTPQARPMAIRASQRDGYRKLFTIVRDIPVDGLTRIKDYFTSDKEMNLRIWKIVHDAVIVRTNYKTDGTVETKMRLSFSEGLYALVFNEVIAVTKSEGREGEKPEKADGSGLIIDARDFTIGAALAPTVVNESETTVYDVSFVDRETVVDRGMCVYMRYPSAARSDVQMGNNPLTVTAVAVRGANNADIVISDGDAARIEEADDANGFRKQCRVMIVGE